MGGSLQTGQTVLHYHVLEQLGAGGMGEVYKAEDLKLGRLVAIKVLPAAERVNENARRRLLQEARSASALNHPHIVTIYAVEQAGPSGCPLDLIAMEYLEGDSLSTLLRRGPLEARVLIDCGVQVADALTAAHQANLIHRDIKPSNIWITAHGHAKVLDFGLAKATPGLPRGDDAATLTGLLGPLTREGLVVGTVNYMSPEQTRGETLDARSDIFSLGCVLYEAATGRPPFRGASLLALWREIAEVHPSLPSTYRPELSREFDFIVERALAKDKERRYNSAAELAQALRQLTSAAGAPAVFDAAPDKEPKADAFVGRESELGRLEQLLQLTRQGSGKIVFLTGEPGIGKTSLAGEFLRRVRRASTSSLLARGACVEQYGTGEAYLPFLDALGSLLSGPGRERVLAVLRTHAPTWCIQLPAAFISTGELERVQRETIGATKERMLREMGDFLGALTSSTSLVLLLEDLHWVDPSSADLIRHLGQRVAGQRILMVGTFRPEDLRISGHPLLNYVREMQAHGSCEEFALQSLSGQQIAAYLNTRFAPNDFPSDLVTLIEAKTEGHALFVTSLAEYLAERADIVKHNDLWTLTRPLAELDLEVPKGVRGMIQKKIEALAAPDRRALEYASIEGEEFTSTIAAALLEVDDLTLEEQFDRLDKVQHLIRTIGAEELPDGSLAMRYRFVHALYQNLFYENLVPKRRILLHRQAGEKLLAHHADKIPPIAAQLARHFELGRDFSRAIEYLIQLGDNSLKLYDGAAAVTHYTHALALVERLPESDRVRHRMRLYQQRGAAWMSLGRLADTTENLTMALDQARALGDATAECAALNALAHLGNFSHDLAQMAARATEALRIAKDLANPQFQAEALSALASSHLVSGRLDESRTLFDESLRLGRSIQHAPAMVRALTYQGLNHFFRTEYEQAEALELEASHLASSGRDAFNLSVSLFYLGLSRANQGRLTEALTTLNQCLELARRNGNQLALSRVPNGLGFIYGELYDLPRGIRYNRECVEISRHTRIAEAEANALINLVYEYTYAGESDLAAAALREVEPLLDRDPWNRWRFFGIRMQAGAAEFWLAQNKLQRAHEHATQLLDNAGRHGVPKYTAIGRRILGEAALVAGESDRAIAEFRTALEVLRKHPAPLVTWRIWAALARALRQAGEHQGALQACIEGAAIVKGIASQVTDDPLRQIFLNAPPIRELFAGLTP